MNGTYWSHYCDVWGCGNRAVQVRFATGKYAIGRIIALCERHKRPS